MEDLHQPSCSKTWKLSEAVKLGSWCSVYVLAQSFNTHIEVADLIKVVKPY